jgi:alpha-galactosidase
MKLDPRFALTQRELGGQLSLTISASRELAIGEEASLLFETELAELAELALAPAGFAAEASKPARRNFIVNGWQSWSFGGELASFERVRPSYIKRFCLFSQGPAAAAPRHEVMSYFYFGIRAGETRLFLVSRNSGHAPLVFRADRGGTKLRVEAIAAGARYAAGDVVAELRLFCREGYFASKAAFRDIFADFRHFDRLAFLGHDGNLVPGGYESWYNHYTDISESLMEADLAGLDEPGNLISDYYVRRGKPTIFQVDDGWERRVGEWEVDEAKFPKGLALLASRIEDKGYVPGLWFAPFLVTKACAVHRDHQDWILRDQKGRKVLAGWNPNWDGDFWTLDLSLPEVEDYLVHIFERAVEEWGYRYLKLDFLYAGFLPGVRRGGGAAFQHYDRIIGRITSRIRDKAGRPVAWLGCGAPLEVSWRHFPLMRIGADTREAWEYEVLRLVQHEGRPAAYANLLATVGRSILDGTVFVNDPDVVFCREENNRLTETEKELVGLTGFLLASQIMYSDGAGEVRSPSVRAFTARLLAAFDHLEGKDFGATRLAKAVFRIESDDGKVRGLMNLSGRACSLPAAAFDGNPIVEHAARKGGTLAFAPHSISLYEV